MNYLTVRSRFATQGLISSHELRQAFPDFNKRRLVEWQARGYMQRIVNRWYRFTEMPVDEALLWFTATHIYQPAYLSLDTALSYHGLTPEGVCTLTCELVQNPGVTHAHRHVPLPAPAASLLLRLRGAAAGHRPVLMAHLKKSPARLLLSPPRAAYCRRLRQPALQYRCAARQAKPGPPRRLPNPLCPPSLKQRVAALLSLLPVHA
jgi:hypothetical protein